MITIPGLEHYFGGKGGSGTYQTIINHIPPHDCYIEPFLGSGAILRHKKPAEVSVGIDKDEEVVELWQPVITGMPISVYQGCGIEFLEALSNDPGPLKVHLPDKTSVFRTTSCFIYIDPPYLLDTRRSKKSRYKCELTEKDHRRLLDVLNKLSDYNIAISCYDNPLYGLKLKGWNFIDYNSMTRTGLARERLYMNYPAPVVLHDFSFLGENFRERERISNKIKRHVARLKRLPELERNAILTAIEKSGLLRLRVYSRDRTV